MCGRYNITKRVETIEQELEIEILERELFDGLINIGPGTMAPVLTSENQKNPTFMQFGFTPFWAKKKMYVFNARSEGDFNKENNPVYNGTKGILQKPMFRSSIRKKRCLVIAGSFIEGSTKEKLSNPYLIFPNNFECFTFGGIWDEWVDKETGEILQSFAIITTASNSITQAVNHHRAPLIISKEFRKEWLNPETPLNDIVNLMHPFNGNDYNAFRISPQIKNPREKNIEFIRPKESPIKKITTHKVVEELELLGMGESPARKRRDSEN